MSNELNREQSRPNVKYLVDGNGRGWICEGHVRKDDDPRQQACVPAEEIIYDRMFGG